MRPDAVGVNPATNRVYVANCASRLSPSVPLLLLAGSVLAADPARAANQVPFARVSAPNLPVGSTILFGVNAPATDPPTLYRFSVAPPGAGFAVHRDFSPRKGFDWTPIDDGRYDVKVTAKTPAGELLESQLPYLVLPRALSYPVVTAVNHPLVALYSAPPCVTPGATVRVRFRVATAGAWQYTPWKPCGPQHSVNFYVAGMAADTAHQLQHEVLVPLGTFRGPMLPFRTGAVSTAFPPTTISHPADAGSSLAEGILLTSVLPFGNFPYSLPHALNLSGQVIWYYDRLTVTDLVGSYLVRPVEGGTMLLILKDGFLGQVLREIDLAGNTLRETNLPRVREQLQGLGLIDPATHFVGVFHHDAVRLPNGHTLVLVSVEHVVDSVDYLGDAIVDLDEDLQVAWAFNAFDHLSLARQAPLGEECTSPLDGCPPLFLGSRVKDWTHANAIAYLPSDGNLLVSIRNQDWIIKVDYQSGAAAPRILWTLGEGGDFEIVSTDPGPWFSHQHYLSLDGDRLLLYDNGNTRAAGDPSALSRGQALRIDEPGRTVGLDFNVTLGVYSPAFGTAHRLSNGNYHFESGFLAGGVSQAIEVTPSGETSFLADTGATACRSWRMKTLYAP